MKTFIKQVYYIIACSIIVGILFNYLRPTGIPFVTKQTSGFSDNYLIDEFIIEFIERKRPSKTAVFVPPLLFTCQKRPFTPSFPP